MSIRRAASYTGICHVAPLQSYETRMLFPIGDDNQKLEGTAYVTLAIIALNLLVFFVFQGAGANSSFTYGWSVIPTEITRGVDLVEPQTLSLSGGETASIPQAPGPAPIYLTILSAMFMHGGYMHIFGNMLFLWIFGDNVEHRFGSGPFLLFYLACGLVATVAQIVLDPGGVIPNLGASGAISGVLGGYLLLFPRNRVRVIFLYMLVAVPAWVAIGAWIVFQFINGVGAVAVAEEVVGGVAYGAHIGGFFAGMALAGVLRGVIKVPTKKTRRRRGR